MINNKKGMTLIEVVVSLLILSTASMIMVFGFVTAYRMFFEANQYNNAANEARSTLVSQDDQSSDIIYSSFESQMSITVNGETIAIPGSLNQANSLSFSDIQLKRFVSTVEKVEVSTPDVDDTEEDTNPSDPDSRTGYKTYTNYCEMMGSIQQYLTNHNIRNSSVSSSAVKTAIYDWLVQEKGEAVAKKAFSNGGVNIVDNLKRLYIAVYGQSVGYAPITQRMMLWYTTQSDDFSASNEKPYIFPTVCWNSTQVNDDMNWQTIFSPDFYKEYAFVYLYNANNGNRPSKVVAVYNNYKETKVTNPSSNNDQEWFVYNRKGAPSDMSVDDFELLYPTFSSFYEANYNKSASLFPIRVCG